MESVGRRMRVANRSSLRWIAESAFTPGGQHVTRFDIIVGLSSATSATTSGFRGDRQRGKQSTRNCILVDTDPGAQNECCSNSDLSISALIASVTRSSSGLSYHNGRYHPVANDLVAYNIRVVFQDAPTFFRSPTLLSPVITPEALNAQDASDAHERMYTHSSTLWILQCRHRQAESDESLPSMISS